jgi:hypothetical protein
VAIVTLQRGTITTVLTTELNSLANNTYTQSSVAGSSGILTSTQYLLAEVELVCTFGVAPTANTGFSVWFIREVDGTNYEQGYTGSTQPVRAPDCVLPLQAVTTAQRVIVAAVPLPPGNFYVGILNNGTGQALAASGNTVKIRPYTPSVS